MGKLTILGAAATGYVLGTRAGRERYEQIKTQATRFWQNPRVQKAASDAQDVVKDQAPVVKDKVSGAAHKAATTAKSAASHGDHADHADSTTSPTVVVQEGNTHV